jgi:heme oxygenase
MTVQAEASDGQATGFARQLRDASMAAHSHAESSPFFAQLFDGTLPLADYVVLVVQLRAVYAALEAPAERMRTDPVVAPFVVDALHRSAAYDRDLAVLTARLPGICLDLSPATASFVARLGQVANRPHQWVAHHYTRYLGDLSGGQQMRKAAEAAYGLGEGNGSDAYRFPGLGAPGAFKRDYRARLDTAAWTPGQKEEVLEEVLTAYQLNTALVRELGTGALTP